MAAAARERSLGYAWDEAMARLLTYYRALIEEPSEPLRVAA
jgi:hypothetical protein